MIAVDIHYAVEVILKSFLAYENKKIAKTHNLLDIYKIIIFHITFEEDELDLMDTITSYHIKGSYPPIDRKMPSRSEIKKVIDFTDKLFDRVCKILKINKIEVMK